MAQFDIPVVNSWYKLPDSQTFRVISLDIDGAYIAIQYTDGTIEGVDVGVWKKLGAEKTEPSEKWLSEFEDKISELDFYEMGGAPGAEGFDFAEHYIE
jgi:hypothetical protein